MSDNIREFINYIVNNAYLCFDDRRISGSLVLCANLFVNKKDKIYSNRNFRARICKQVGDNERLLEACYSKSVEISFNENDTSKVHPIYCNDEDRMNQVFKECLYAFSNDRRRAPISIVAVIHCSRESRNIILKDVMNLLVLPYHFTKEDPDINSLMKGLIVSFVHGKVSDLTISHDTKDNCLIADESNATCCPISNEEIGGAKVFTSNILIHSHHEKDIAFKSKIWNHPGGKMYISEEICNEIEKYAHTSGLENFLKEIKCDSNKDKYQMITFQLHLFRSIHDFVYIFVDNYPLLIPSINFINQNS